MKGHLKSSHKHIEKPHRHDFYVTVLFNWGVGVHEIDFQSYDDVQAGSLFFLSPWSDTQLGAFSDDTDGYIFFFSQEYYNMHYVNQKLKNFPLFCPLWFLFPENFSWTIRTCIRLIPLFTELQEESFYRKI